MVGILLRARKHKLLDFEGEMLYQRRDDDVPIFLLRPIVEIRRELNAKVEEIKRGASPAPQSTSVLLDKTAHEQNLKVLEEKRRVSKSRTPSPAVKSKSRSKSPTPEVRDKAEAESSEAAAAVPSTAPVAIEVAPTKTPVEATVPIVVIDQPAAIEIASEEVTPAATTKEELPASESQTAEVPPEAASPADSADTPTAVPADAVPVCAAPDASLAEPSNELPTIVIEASATFVRTVSVEQVSEQVSEQVGTAENA